MTRHLAACILILGGLALPFAAVALLQHLPAVATFPASILAVVGLLVRLGQGVAQ
jgi:hypothetical protein